MAGKNGNEEVGVYVNITPELDSKLSLIARLLPPKEGSKRWFKKDIIAKACQLYTERFFSLLEGATTIDDMMERAKEIDPDAIELEAVATTAKDMSEENAGLKEL